MLDETVRTAAAELYYPGMGTENVAPLLYALVRMLKPRSCLEVGLGYTTPFLARALLDNDRENQRDLELMAAGPDAAPLEPAAEERRVILSPTFFAGMARRRTRLHAVDSFVLDDFSEQRVARVLRALGVEDKVAVLRCDFAAAIAALDRAWLPLDFVWFDCGGLPQAIEFLNLYWPHVDPHHGTIVLHYTHFKYSVSGPDGERYAMLIDPLVNELKKRQALTGATFEVQSLLEPNKIHQSSVTMVRKLPWSSRVRHGSLVDEGREFFGLALPPLRALD